MYLFPSRKLEKILILQIRAKIVQMLMCSASMQAVRVISVSLAAVMCWCDMCGKGLQAGNVMAGGLEGKGIQV